MSSSSSSTPAMQAPGKPPRITQHAFEVVIGLMLGLALISATFRTYIRLSKFGRFLLDDIFFYAAIVFMICGTGLLYKDTPLIYLQENVEAGLEMPPADLAQRLIHSEKLQDASTVLLASTIFSIKFSFLCFFKHLIWQNKPLMIWWWTVLATCIPTAAVFMFSDFIACDYFNEEILVKCVTPQALDRQNATFKASVALDIVTDAFITSIPIILLWKVRVSLQRKAALCGILCLSIFMIIIAIVRFALGHGAMGQVDAAWAIFWLQVEGCVAVIVCSVSAFRALFVSHQASKYNEKSPGQSSGSGKWSKARLLWPTKWSRSGTSGHDTFNVSRRGPDAPSPANGVNTHIKAGSMDSSLDGSVDDKVEIPLQVHVRKDISSTADANALSLGHDGTRPSAESFV